MSEITLALGSNLGNRRENLATALKLLEQHINIHKISSLLENPAVGGETGQGDFLNSALTGSTELSPTELLKFVKEIEQTIGRDFTTPRWSAREIDIDIIFYDNLVLDTPELTIPHPLMHQRDFVLIPLTEITPKAIHPLLKTSINNLYKCL